MIYKLSPRFILVRIKKSLPCGRLFLWFFWRDSFGEAEQAADYGGPYVDERLFRAENAVAGIA